MKRKAWIWPALVVLLALGGWLAWNNRGASREPPQSNIAAAAGVDAAGYARALGPQPLTFPADSGPHDDFATEWWYYTGNLTAANGERFGYQLTFFRRALAPPTGRPARASDWSATQVYMAHPALTDVAGKQHYNFERLARGAVGLAGAQAQPYRVWLDDWQVVSTAGSSLVQLQAAEGAIALKLDLRSLKDPVLQGDRGYSRKGPEPGNASYYYSLTRIATQGEVSVHGQTFAVDGLSWMDHEYSTSALSQGQVGWDWFSLQLSDNRELMLFQLRRADGSADPFSGGALIEPDGTTRRIGREDFRIQPTGRWRSPRSGATYPSGWKLSIAAAGIELTISPYLADQEMNVGYTYWEGAVRVEGTEDGRPVAGSGYTELTGYAGSMSGQF